MDDAAIAARLDYSAPYMDELNLQVTDVHRGVHYWALRSASSGKILCVKIIIHPLCD